MLGKFPFSTPEERTDTTHSDGNIRVAFDGKRTMTIGLLYNVFVYVSVLVTGM